MEVFESVIEGTEVVEPIVSASAGEVQDSIKRTMLLPHEIDEIINHMNNDHSDAVLTYVHHYAGIVEATSATLDKLDEETMWIIAEVEGVLEYLEIPLSNRIANIKEAEKVMVEMLFTARAQLSNDS